MAEYIEREALLKEMLGLHTIPVYIGHRTDEDVMFSTMVSIVEEQPSTDVVEVKWVSVNDRLPETNGKYLCADYSKTFKEYSIRVLDFAKDLYKLDEFEFKNEKGKSGFYSYEGEWGYCECEGVTHWMPLPEPPKKEGADNNE